MRLRPRFDTVLAVVATAACAAFIVSFVFGLGGIGSNPAAVQPADEWPAAALPPAAGRVEVLNASGRSGLARRETGRLRAAGFDVVFFGNAPASAGDRSVVLDRTGNDAVARAAARAMGIRPVRTERDSTLFLDATVIIGVDWAPLAESGGDRGAWDRVLDWIRPDR
jgi:hypothetical protein